jgi:DNA repair protein RecN (Recombination protein N)
VRTTNSSSKGVISASGANKQFVNCSPVTIQVLKSIGEYLVDLHGPHDHQSLHSRERQIEMLDKYIGIEELLSKYSTAWRSWRAAVTELDDLQHSERASQQQIDMLRHQIQEITDAALKPGEDEEIESRHRIAANGARLAELCGGLTDRIADGEGSVLEALREVGKMIHDLEKIDPTATRLFEEFESAQIALREIENNVRDYADELEIDPREFSRLEDRMSVLQSLKRKYAPTLAEILSYQAECESKLARIEGRSEEIERLQALITQRRADVDKAGKAISKKRTEAAPRLSKEIATHLTDLGFKRSVFEVQLASVTEPQKHGFEEVDFLFAPNPGEPLKPLRLTASSGEMSRVLLAVKSALARQDAVPLLVFDEIDANVGGNIAEAVGRKMSALGKTHQVIAITHFPQVASLAQSHFRVTKEVEGNRTRSTITEVKTDERLDELARMLGGSQDSARKHAASLLAG